MKKRVLSVLLALVLVVGMSVPAFADGGGLSLTILEQVKTFVIRLIVPPDEYFYDKLDELNEITTDKFGGVAQLHDMLNEFMESLQMPQSAGLVFSLPDDYFSDGYRGFSINMFAMAGPYINLLRGVLNAACCIMTAILCYHKLRTFFSEGVA